MSDTLASPSPETAAGIPDYPMSRSAGCPFAPPPGVMSLAAAKPLTRVRIWDGSTPWLITGYEQVRELFSDSRVSVDDRLPGFPHWNAGMLSTVHKRPRSVFTADGEEHTRFRRMLSKPFTFKRVEALRPTIQQITDEHIDAMLAGPQPADLVAKLALPVPSLVISQLLGVPYEDAEMFQHHANVGLARYATGADTVKGAMSLHKYLAELVEAKMANPAEDAVSDLAERVKAGELSVKEAAQLGTGLLIAGHETTANMIGLGVLALLVNPDQAGILRDAHDPKIVANAVEELLRYLSIIQNGQRRVAHEDIHIGGETIRAGEGIIIDLAPANWDAHAFTEPDRLYLHRAGAERNVAFGYGRHQCVGQQLARAELQIVYRTLLQRIPTLTLATALEDVPFKDDRLAYGVYELPVTW
ncbi:cytochrome P450 105Q4 Cyp105Q4 [Mycobacterium liflandii 128FXT]|uniref:Cytochrome P450 n=3 Tax=Mycobacteriaceae TaxID=1762 RepID=A0A9N7QRJ4_9MYCO|nr:MULTISPECIES: cytochrome P450 [Mycobacterium]ULL12970.1 cytochrome P450 [Mycobacterium liflandii]AGC64468.1 cytochrome P450 105Q4 Cyp105Q4 [Mycobacterium liflandii 128FXT]EPQ45599.1 putative cytochrome P450 hydroxylase [Mycobacterium sp. 012931]MBC9864359.1 Cytochrome P450 [Mycobacterium pseudoshottsii]MDC9005739.1 cytochrome P450 [Mycobacterium marinum]